ncbi:tetratricopeptide repeat protein [Nocardia gipuzkoensis]|nr:tetratricopeptide repeat protein [Streptomyces gardneri]
MSPRKGGESDKIGNIYERQWTTKYLLEVLAGESEWVRVEPLGDLGSGVEFLHRRHDGIVEGHQVKRQFGNANGWTVDALTARGIWVSAEHHIDRGREFHFTSMVPFRALQELADRTRNSNDYASFVAEGLPTDLNDLFTSMGKIYRTPGETYRILRRFHVHVADEMDIRRHNTVMAQLFLKGGTGEQCMLALGDVIDSRFDVEWTAERILEKLRPDYQRRVIASRGDITDAGDGEVASAAPVVVGRVPAEPRHFVTRTQLQGLAERVAESQVTVVTGMPGAGKTQVAASYARSCLDSGVGLVGWVNAGSNDSLYAGLAEIAHRFGISDANGNLVVSAHRLRDFLNTRREKGLVVFDNATDIELVRQLLPTTGGTTFMITCTKRAFTNLGVEVDAGTGYTREESLAYLEVAAGINDDPVGAGAVAKELGDLPLALAAAAAAIRAVPGLGYARYLQRLRSQPLPQALRYREGQDHPLRADQAIMIAIDIARAATCDPDRDTVVAWLLDLFAVFASTGVVRALLTHPDPDLDEDIVDEAIEHCIQQSVLTWSADGDMLTAHRLTARVLRERAYDDNTLNTVLGDALTVLEPRLFNESDARHQWLEDTHLVDHIDSLTTASALLDQAELELPIRLLAARRWSAQQLIRNAVYHPEHAHHILIDNERLLGPDDGDTVAARNHLAYVYEFMGCAEQAAALYYQTLTQSVAKLGPDHPEIITARDNFEYLVAYDPEAGLRPMASMFEQALADSEQVLGPDHPTTRHLREQLAAILKGPMVRVKFVRDTSSGGGPTS